MSCGCPAWPMKIAAASPFAWRNVQTSKEVGAVLDSRRLTGFLMSPWGLQCAARKYDGYRNSHRVVWITQRGPFCVSCGAPVSQVLGNFSCYIDFAWSCEIRRCQYPEPP